MGILGWKSELTKKWQNTKLNICMSLYLLNKLNIISSHLPAKQTSGRDTFVSEFCKTFMEEITRSLNKSFKKMEVEGIFPNSVGEVNITLILWPKFLQEKKILGSV